MTKDGTEAVAFAKPGGEACGAARTRPIDLAHLARQTLILQVFESQIAIIVQ